MSSTSSIDLVARAGKLPAGNAEWTWRIFAIAAGLFTFLLTQLFHWLLDPDPDRIRIRLIADAISAVVIVAIGLLAVQTVIHRRRAAIRDLRTIGELNHNIRNALEIISMSAYLFADKSAIARIAQSVDRIETSLRRATQDLNGGQVPEADTEAAPK